ncbi:MAG: hypothetical protein KKE17_13905 [Proteobacteria bacterium]|nr:hypothetical protein [Pseudomonadota bacterium]
MGSNWWRVIITVFLAISLLAPGAAFAGANDLAKEAEKIIRDAERKMHSGKSEEAATMLQEAAGLLEQGKTEEPDNPKISQVEKKLERMQQNVDKKLGHATVNTSPSGPALPKKPQPKAISANSSKPATTTKQIDLTKLPAGLKKNLEGINENLDNADEYAGKDANNANRWLKEAESSFAYIDRMYANQFDPTHPDYVAVKNRYNELVNKVAAQGNAEIKAEADAAGAEAAKEKKSEEWVAKFREYLAYSSGEGHNPAKLVFVPGTSEPEKFADAKKRYEAFKKFYEEYKKTDFPNGRTWALEDIADNQAPMRLKDFEEGFASRMGSVSERAESEISAAMAYLEKDNGWKSDKSIRPNLLDHKRMTSIGEETKNAVTALGTDPKAQQVQTKFDALVAKDKGNRQIRMERTYMTPDKYTGKDIQSLKEKATSLVKSNNKEGGNPLRCTIIDENWREESVEEWTDTSKTTLRWRTTRHQTAQVAAASDGVRLITVALAQDKLSDGGWGPLYGNLHQGSDPMLESNVSKNGP